MSKGRGWHGDSTGHREAALKANERWYQTQWRLTKEVVALTRRNFGWRDTPRLLFWFGVYGTFALVATLVWAVTRIVVWPYYALRWIGRKGAAVFGRE